MRSALTKDADKKLEKYGTDDIAKLTIYNH